MVSPVRASKSIAREAARASRGRPPTSGLDRAGQLRSAKRAQRKREREAGLVHLQLKLPRDAAARLAFAARQPSFAGTLDAFLDAEVVRIVDYPALATIAWNRARPFVAPVEALGLYERNWRFVDAARLKPRERALIERLSKRFGGGPFDG